MAEFSKRMEEMHALRVNSEDYQIKAEAMEIQKKAQSNLVVNIMQAFTENDLESYRQMPFEEVLEACAKLSQQFRR